MPNPIRRRRLGKPPFLVAAANFTSALNQHMDSVDTAALSMGTGVHPTFALWVYPQSLTAIQYLFHKGGNGIVDLEYLLRITGSTGTLFFQVSNGSALAGFTTTVSRVIANHWNFIVAQWTGSTFQISINNAAFEAAGFGEDMQDGSGNIRLGTRQTDTSFSLNGALSQFGIAKSVLSASEITQLWNGGKGLSYQKLPAALAAKFAVYYNLADAGGSGATWADSADSSSLTAATGTAAPTAVLLPR